VNDVGRRGKLNTAVRQRLVRFLDRVDTIVEQGIRSEFFGFRLSEIEPYSAAVEKCHRLTGNFEEQLQPEYVLVELDCALQVIDTDMDLPDPLDLSFGISCHGECLLVRKISVAGPPEMINSVN
jgi:hypothetical protein